VEVTVKDIIEIVKGLAWPFVTLVILFFLRKEIRTLFRSVIDRVTKISGAGMLVELAANQVQTERLAEPTSTDEKAKSLRSLEIAKAIAPKFDYWMKHYNHPLGKTHYYRLLDWLVADRGAKYLSGDYQTFKALAQVLSKMGYDTIPVPSEGEFMVKVAEADEREEYRLSRSR